MRPNGCQSSRVGWRSASWVWPSSNGTRAFSGSWRPVLILQVVVGIAGFYFHLVADINGLSSSLFDNFIHGAPVFAPLLFVDLALLAMIGLWERHALGDAPSKIATAPNPALR